MFRSASRSLASKASTHFGFRTILENEKEQMVGKVFSNVASKYDIMNDVMSGTLHRHWKSTLISQLAPSPSTQHLDVAGGSGDIAFRLLDSIKARYGNYGTSKCTVLDINREMLDVGVKRSGDKGYPQGVLEFVEGNAEALDVESGSLDSYTISFGIRNCTHIDKVLDEAYRVLKKGGRFTCLEFSHIPNQPLQSMYDLYSFNVIPAMGELIVNDRDSYQYLVESIRRFPKQDNFAEMIRTAGFKFVKYENLTLGIAAIHTGWKV